MTTSIDLDASPWRDERDFYNALLPALGAPGDHPRELAAVADTLRFGSTFSKSGPFRLTIRNIAFARPAARAYAGEFAKVVAELRRTGCDIALVMEESDIIVLPVAIAPNRFALGFKAFLWSILTAAFLFLGLGLETIARTWMAALIMAPFALLTAYLALANILNARYRGPAARITREGVFVAGISDEVLNWGDLHDIKPSRGPGPDPAAQKPLKILMFIVWLASLAANRSSGQPFGTYAGSAGRGPVITFKIKESVIRRDMQGSIYNFGRLGRLFQRDVIVINCSALAADEYIISAALFVGKQTHWRLSVTS